MVEFDLSKITGREPPLETDEDRANELAALRERVAIAEDGWHMANGTADLAMKHRDIAEARVARCMDLAAELRRYFDSGTLDTAADLYLLLQEVEAAGATSSAGGGHF